jgi:hypothetical protein
MSWLLFSIYFIAILFLIRKIRFFHLEGLPKWAPAAVFVIKIFAGLCLWAIYTFYYTDRVNSDIWKYFDDSKIMYDAPAEDLAKMITGIGDKTAHFDSLYYFEMDHWYQEFDNNLLNDAHIIIRFNTVMRFISLGNYHIHSLFMNLLAFIGLCGLYAVFYSSLKKQRYILAAILFLSPSLLFWGSGVMKEGLMLFSMGMIIYQFFKYLEDQKKKRILFILLCSWLLYLTKFYVLAALIPALAGCYWSKKSSGKIALKYVLSVLIFISLGLSMKFIYPTYDPLRILALKQNDFIKLAKGGTYVLNDTIVAYLENKKHDEVIIGPDSVCKIKLGVSYIYWYFNPDFSDTIFVKSSTDPASYKIMTDYPRAGSYMETQPLSPDLLSFIKASPQAMYRVLFRPYIWEGKNPLLLLPAIENLGLLLLLVLVILKYQKPESPALIGFCITFSILLLLVMGLTTPVLGALVRYKIAALPLLMLGLLQMCKRRDVQVK